MPYFIHLTRIDWHVSAASDAVRAALADGDPARETNHTFDTFSASLQAFATAHPDAIGDALVDDGFGNLVLLRVREGKVLHEDLDERLVEGGSLPADVSYDDVLSAKVANAEELAFRFEELLGDSVDTDPFELPLHYPDEATLRTLMTEVADAMDPAEEGGAFIAEVDWAHFLVELAPGRARLRALAYMHEPELVRRLLNDDYATIPASRRTREPLGKHAQSLYWPDAMLEYLVGQATRLDRSLSYVVQIAFKKSFPSLVQMSAPEITAAIDDAQLRSATQRKQTLYFPGQMLDELEAIAARQGTSLSRIAHAAVAMARADLEARSVKEN